MFNYKLYHILILIILLAVVNIFAQGSPNVPLLAHFNQYSSTGYNDCWGYTAPDGREYALLGVLDGTSIIDITDTSNIVEVAFISSTYSIWKDIKTYQHYAYVVNESGGGLQIIDLSDLPNSASLASTYTGFSTSHNIYIDIPSKMLYAEGSFNEPVRILSLDDPLNPLQIASFGIECHDVFVRDGLAFISEGTQGSFGIYDVSNPFTPSFLERIFVPAAGYCHNAWSTENNNYLMTTEETNGKTIKLWDISNLSNISLTDDILGPGGLAHNTHVKGDFAYVSHYSDGLRIYDISDPFDIFETGYYDTYPGPGGGFDGAWGAYPFFSSGKVLISDMQSGLYVVYFDGAVTPLIPSIALSQDSLMFDSTAVGQSSMLNLDVQNAGGDTLKITDVISTNIFFSAFPTIFAVPQGLSQGVSITFSPQSPGFHTGQIRFATNDPTHDTLDVYVQGTAIAPNGINTTNPVAEKYSISQNYPNPFNPQTTFHFNIASSVKVEIVVFNSLGQKVVTLVDGVFDAGSHTVVWDGRDFNGKRVGSGTYLYRFRANGKVVIGKMIMTK